MLMPPPRSLIRDGKKFMWDGNSYASHDDASRGAEGYRNDGFEVHLLEQDGSFSLYTRRVVQQAVVTAQ